MRTAFCSHADKCTRPVELVDALIGIPVSEGTHTIEMKFFPKGMAAGIVLSLLGIATLVVIWFYEKKTNKILLDRLYEV